MKRLCFLSALLACFVSISARAEVSAPPETVDSAIEAVEALGQKVVMGDHAAAFERMHPKWRQRMAKRLGGMEQLEEQLESIGPAMARNGLSIISFKAVGNPRIHEVSPEETAGGEVAYRTWVMLVPTVTRLRIVRSEQPKGAMIDSYGFQVAVADKDELDWSFINGSDVTVPDLRSLFTSLPANLDLPEVRREVVE